MAGPSWIARADAALEASLRQETEAPAPLHGAMRYAVLGGGKRLRPQLVYAGGAACGEHGEVLDPAACAVELIHAYSLIHDDLPAMDNDELRRGRPTCHVAYGEAMAILAGDALQALAFEILARDGDETPQAAIRIRMLQVLGGACGSTGMAGGQALDLAATGKSLGLAELEHMHACKTGALIRASVKLGALAAGCTNEEVLAPLDRCAAAVGIAFQVRDDILDVEADSDTLGKTAGKDAEQDKPTFPSILGMQAARDHLLRRTEEALQALSGFDASADPLRQLARYAADRPN